MATILTNFFHYKMNLTKRTQRLLLILITVLLLGTLVPVAVVYNLKAGDRNSEEVAENSIAIADDVFLVQINVTSLSTINHQANLHFVVQSTGKAFVLSGNSKSASFSPADFNPEVDLPFAVVESTANKYPFDKYVIAGTFVFRNQNGTATFPSHVVMDASIDTWSLIDSGLYDIGTAQDPENQQYVNTVAVYLEYRRGPVLIVFSIFLGLLMWLLSLSAFTMSSLIWLRGRKVEPPTIAVVGALLFALPAMRNVQP